MKHDITYRKVRTYSKWAVPAYFSMRCSCGWSDSESESEEALQAVILAHKVYVLLEAAGIEFNVTEAE